MSRWSLCLLAAALFAGLGAIGCGQKTRPEVSESADEKPTAQVSASRTPAADPEPKAAPAKPADAPIKRDALHQAFADAAFGPDNPPMDVLPPVDRTLTDRSAPALYEQVSKTWDSVRFTTADGKKIEYIAEISTSHGLIKMALLPELAPNHARNFIVLARLGYYNGLRFDRIHREKGEGGEMHCIEGGCPLGTGAAGTGSLGYWLKDEFTPGNKMSHTPGVVGACRAVEADTAATKFYINLNEAPFRDGYYSLFGKVIEGLDVARTISAQPIVNDSEDGARGRPQKPIAIHKVTIQETTVPASKN